MNCEILAVGTDIVLDSSNSGLGYISEELGKLGINVLYHSMTGDSEERLRQAFKLAYTRSDVIVVIGGLGSSIDDITKEVVFDEMGLDTVLNRYCYEHITEQIEKSGKSVPESVKKLASFPENAVVCTNDAGIAPGCIIPDGEKTVVILPSALGEIRHIFESGVIPYFKKRTNSAVISKTICAFGIKEAAAREKLSDLLKSADPSVAISYNLGILKLKVTAKASDVTSAKRILRPVVNDIQRRLGSNIFGYNNDTPESVLVTTLRDMGLTIAIAESCTGGLISEKLTNVPGSSQVLGMGLCTYSNEAKHKLLGIPNKTITAHNAVSGEVAKLMAEGVRKKSKADIGVSTTGIAGPGGALPGKPVGTVYIAVSYKSKTFTKKLSLANEAGTDREAIRELAAYHALDLVRTVVANDGDFSAKAEAAEEKVTVPPAAAAESGFSKQFREIQNENRRKLAEMQNSDTSAEGTKAFDIAPDVSASENANEKTQAFIPVSKENSAPKSIPLSTDTGDISRLVDEILADAKTTDEPAAKPAPKQKAASFAGQKAKQTAKSNKNKSGKKKRPLPLRIIGAIIPLKGDKAGEVIRKIVFLLSFCIFAFSITSILLDAKEVAKMGSIVSSMQNTYGREATNEELSKLPEGALPEFASLYSINPEVIGWIQIPNAQISYVVTQSQDSTNPAYDKYLNKVDWKLEQSKYGCIYADPRSKITKEMMDNTIIYGHNMYPLDKDMFFSHLVNFENLDYYKQNPIVYFDSLYQKMEWKIFSVMYVSTNTSDSAYFDYINEDYLTFETEEEFNEYYNNIMDRSIIYTDVDVKYGDKLLTLSTCEDRYFKGGRIVIFARQVRSGESTDVNVDAASINQHPIMPDTWVQKYGNALLAK
ncbi:MAG: competence/damage-inducible protein A [Oscillospiraceae bacterium]